MPLAMLLALLLEESRRIIVNVLTITQLNNLIKRTLDREYLLKNLYVSGTIINAKRHSSGHMYFSLKDEESAIDVTMWSSTIMQKD